MAKIILCCWGSIMETGIERGLSSLGITCIRLDRELKNYDTDADYLGALSSLLLSHPDAHFVFSVNFVPVIAMACKAHQVPYLSWTVDCPSLTLYSDTVAYPTNYLFLFDRIQAEKLSSRNPGHVFHLPLAFDPFTAADLSPTPADHENYDCDISFVGSLYLRGNKYDAVADRLSPYLKGYLDAVITAQKQVYGYYLTEDALSDPIVSEFMDLAGFGLLPNYKADRRTLLADYYLGYKCTQLERVQILREVSKLAQTSLYTTEDTASYPEIQNRGIADTACVAPKVYACSRINLNISLRPIQSGIPLRCFDIMGMGGFLISNYQPELAEHFIDGEELVLYESIPDLLSKIRYYLSHEEERTAIAACGREKVLKDFTYGIQLTKIIHLFLTSRQDGKQACP